MLKTLNSVVTKANDENSFFFLSIKFKLINIIFLKYFKIVWKMYSKINTFEKRCLKRTIQVFAYVCYEYETGVLKLIWVSITKTKKEGGGRNEYIYWLYVSWETSRSSSPGTRLIRTLYDVSSCFPSSIFLQTLFNHNDNDDTMTVQRYEFELYAY